MSVKLAMVAVDRFALIQLDRLSAHVIQAILLLLLAFNVSVSLFDNIAILNNHSAITFQTSMSAKLTTEAVSITVVTV